MRLRLSGTSSKLKFLIQDPGRNRGSQMDRISIFSMIQKITLHRFGVRIHDPVALVIRPSQEQIPNHQNMRRPPGKSYSHPNPNSNSHPYGERRYTESICNPIFPGIISASSEYAQDARQKLPKPKHQHQLTPVRVLGQQFDF